MSDATLDDLLRDTLTATTDAERAMLSAQITRFPDVVAELKARIRSDQWDTRRLALHFVSRLAPPPDELTSAIVAVLWSPLSRDPFGEETVLGLVIAGVIATRITAHRHPIAMRLEWIERAIEVGSDEVADHPGEPTQFDHRADIVKRLALDTLAKLDAAIAIERTKHEAMLAKIAGRFETAPGEAIAMVELQAATVDDDRAAWTSAVWRGVAHRFATASPNRRAALEHSLEALRWWASGSSSGGEGMARMGDVHELEREIAALPPL